MRTWQRRVIIIGLVALVLFIGYTVLDMRKSEQREREALEEISQYYTENIRELEAERQEIEKEISDTKTEMHDLTANMGSVLIVCTEPDVRIMSDIEPFIDSYDFIAVVALSEDYFPGDSGCLTAEDMDFLVKKGWEVGISADRGTDIQFIYDRIVNAGYAVPTTVYFPLDDCSLEQEETIKSLGIKTIIEYKAEEEEEEEDESDSSLYHMAAYGNNAAGARNRFLAGIEESESIAFTVGYRLEREKYKSDNFANMLNTISKNKEKGYVAVTGAVEAGERYQLQKSLLDYAGEKYEEKLLKLNEELERIEEEIRFAPTK